MDCIFARTLRGATSSATAATYCEFLERLVTSRDCEACPYNGVNNARHHVRNHPRAHPKRHPPPKHEVAHWHSLGLKPRREDK